MGLLVAAVCGAFALSNAHAATEAWSGSVGIAARDVSFTEHDQAGRTLVSEHGLIPGLQADACHQSAEIRTCIVAEHFSSNISYDGRTQSGVPVSSRTHVAQSRLQALAMWRWTPAVDLAGGIEWKRLDRRIGGNGQALGLQERYSNWRLLAGMKHHAEFKRTHLATRLALVLAEPERISITFPAQLYDAATFRSRPAAGLRLGMTATLQQGASVGLEFDWMRVRRSGDYPLYRAGAVVGSVAQPEHVQRLLTLALRYAF